MKTFLLSLLLGILISLSLFWLMQMLISNNQQQFEKTESLQMTEFIRLLKPNTKLQTKDRKKPDQPPPPENRPPPPPMQMQQTQVAPTDAPKMDMPNLDIPLQTKSFNGSLLNGLQISKSEGGLSTSETPLVRINPRYPMRAQSRRIEGWVIVQFTITKEGNTKNPVVIDNHPNSIFNNAALEAIRRWKYKPKIVDGKAIERKNQSTRLKFTLPKSK